MGLSISSVAVTAAPTIVEVVDGTPTGTVAPVSNTTETVSSATPSSSDEDDSDTVVVIVCVLAGLAILVGMIWVGYTKIYTTTISRISLPQALPRLSLRLFGTAAAAANEKKGRHDDGRGKKVRSEGEQQADDFFDAEAASDVDHSAIQLMDGRAGGMDRQDPRKRFGSTLAVPGASNEEDVFATPRADEEDETETNRPAPVSSSMAAAKKTDSAASVLGPPGRGLEKKPGTPAAEVPWRSRLRAQLSRDHADIELENLDEDFP
ncbi:unnamed protein product [Amoebophrya sp. A120]|nr:unnamed protein product [Amoebophrya sp. A120]|eukprot:GSA120T00005160001.1